MLIVKVDVANLEYDIHSLVKAFYPEETVKVLTPDKENAEGGLIDCILNAQPTAFYISLLSNPPQIVYSDEENGLTHCYTATAPYDFKVSGDLLRKEDKNKFKQFLYLSLCDIHQKSLPWGNLTGIRPTKIAMIMIEDGKNDAQIADFMKQNHFVSDEKIKLATDIAHREHDLLSKLHVGQGYSLYIGIPFCPTRCLYCSFTSNPICAFEKEVDNYIDCLEKEMVYVSEAFSDRILDSVYVGGGTPTTLSAEQLDCLLSLLEKYFDLSHLLEFTVEAGRADSITKEKLQVLHDHKVGRISVNPQTMKEETLKIIGRQHTVSQVKDAYRLAKEVGFDNINMDMILGLPGEDEGDVAETIRQIKELAPDSLTVHSLAIKRASKLKQWVEENGIDCLNNTDDMMKVAAKGAADMGMDPYYLYRQKNMSGNFENVGYAKPGKYGIYNILIMEEVQTIIALGAGSITKRVFPDGRIERCDNVKDVKLYIEKIDEMIERKRKLFAD